MEDQRPLAKLQLRVSVEHMQFFCTLLQSGIEIPTTAGIDMAGFLGSLEGFSREYLASTVETIFLDGTPVDDLDTIITGDAPVLALSAAMPGLAGAIFRKNSIHSALRTRTASSPASAEKIHITVTLKLFNSIARQRGEELLGSGVTIRADKLSRFLEKRSSLTAYIRGANLNGEQLPPGELLSSLQHLSTLELRITHYNG